MNDIADHIKNALDHQLDGKIEPTEITQNYNEPVILLPGEFSIVALKTHQIGERYDLQGHDEYEWDGTPKGCADIASKYKDKSVFLLTGHPNQGELDYILPEILDMQEQKKEEHEGAEQFLADLKELLKP
ncbi:MAG: hypothetical protein V1725_02480 [archaeon]